MIHGTGTDLILIARIRAALERTEGRLADRILGPEELRVFHARRLRNEGRGIAYLATRFAAKEAVSKALGLGMRWPMTWRAVQTLNDPSGKPVVILSGELRDWVRARGLCLSISLTDERDIAQAFAIAETGAEPLNETVAVSGAARPST